MAVEWAFQEEKLYDAGALFTRVIIPPPIQGETNPNGRYWNIHIDGLNIPRYKYAALLYLADQGVDFDGGTLQLANFEKTNFIDSRDLREYVDHNFPVDKKGLNQIPERLLTSVSPMKGRLLIFKSGKENPHRVCEVTRGNRYLFSIWYSPDPNDSSEHSEALLRELLSRMTPEQITAQYLERARNTSSRATQEASKNEL